MPAPLTLAVHPGALGDVLLAIPALRALRQQRPNSPLTLAAQPRIGNLLAVLGVVDRSVDLEALGLSALFEAEPDGSERGWPVRCGAELRTAGYLVAWIGSRDAQFVRRLTALVPGAVVAPSVGPDREAVWRHLLETAGASDADPTVRAPITVPRPLADDARLALRASGWDGQKRFLIVHAGAGGRGKLWPTAGFAAVLASLAAIRPGLAVVVHRGPADAEAVAALSSRLERRELRLDEPRLPLLAGVLSMATAYLGNDSGISHLAAALGVPAVVLFGQDRIAWRPWAEHLEPLVVSLPTLDEADVTRVLDALRPLLG